MVWKARLKLLAIPALAAALALTACGGVAPATGSGGEGGGGGSESGDDGGGGGGATGGGGTTTGGGGTTTGVTGPLMRPGENCLSCHTFSLAGTVFDASGAAAANVSVSVTDAGGAKLTLTSNAAGNFYATQPVAFPATVWLQKGALGGGMTAPAGSCNACHTPSFRMTIR
jgi:hypothetical protein